MRADRRPLLVGQSQPRLALQVGPDHLDRRAGAIDEFREAAGSSQLGLKLVSLHRPELAKHVCRNAWIVWIVFHRLVSL
jgi:hypothetical protein